VIAVLFGKTFAQDPHGQQWLLNLGQTQYRIPLLPVALDLTPQKPPVPIDCIKSRLWPVDKDQLLTTLGAFLGMVLRPGKQRLFISYRQLDGTDVAKKLFDHLTSLGFDCWLDIADDNHGDPMLEIGDVVQNEIMERLADASAIIQIDTPSAPASPWVRAEIEAALGKMIPILPVVLHDSSVKTQPSRFRQLNDLHRRVCIQSDQIGTQFQIKDNEVAVVADEMSEYLRKIYIRRAIQPRLLSQAFSTNKWKFANSSEKPHLHEATLGPPPIVPLSLLGYCSFEDFFFAPTLRVYLKDIADLATKDKNYARSLYFYDGQLLYEHDIAYIVENEVVKMKTGHTDLIHYDEAVLRILKITGGLNGIFA